MATAAWRPAKNVMIGDVVWVSNEWTKVEGVTHYRQGSRGLRCRIYFANNQYGSFDGEQSLRVKASMA